MHPQEERLMMEEVEQTGKVNIDAIFEEYSSQVVAESAPVDAAASTESDPSSSAWQKLRRDRVNLKEWMDRMQGIEEGKILERRAQREAEEEAILREQAETRDIQQLADHTKGHRSSMMMNSFLAAANQTLELLTEELVDSIALSTEPAQATSRSSAATAAPIDLSEVRSKLKVTMQDDLKQLNITSDNFDLNDPRKRPIGWQQVRLKRVEQLESEERLMGMSEEKIRARRRLKEIEVPCIRIYFYIVLYVF